MVCLLFGTYPGEKLVYEMNDANRGWHFSSSLGGQRPQITASGGGLISTQKTIRGAF
jgi:hypothetical protein